MGDESEAFGHLVGLIELRGMDAEDAVDTAVEQFDHDRDTYEALVEEHWS